MNITISKKLLLLLSIILAFIEFTQQIKLRKSSKSEAKANKSKKKKLRTGNCLNAVLDVNEKDIFRNPKNNSFQIRKTIHLPISLI